MGKAVEAFRTISEVADELEVPKHVLRFWEQRFPQIKPMKRGGGRRYYRPEDLELLRGIRRLLHAEGYTIKGVQKILREQGVDSVKAAGEAQKARGVGEAAPSRASRSRARSLAKSHPRVDAHALDGEAGPVSPAGRSGRSRPGAGKTSRATKTRVRGTPKSPPAGQGRVQLISAAIAELEVVRDTLAKVTASGRPAGKRTPAKRSRAGTGRA